MASEGTSCGRGAAHWFSRSARGLKAVNEKEDDSAEADHATHAVAPTTRRVDIIKFSVEASDTSSPRNYKRLRGGRERLPCDRQDAASERFSTSIVKSPGCQ
jgi:hypothetical protein